MKDILTDLLRSEKFPESIRAALRNYDLTPEEYVRYRRLKEEDRARLLNMGAPWALRCKQFETDQRTRVKEETTHRTRQAREAAHRARARISQWVTEFQEGAAEGITPETPTPAQTQQRNLVAELEKLAEMHKHGILNDTQFEKAKDALLGK